MVKLGTRTVGRYSGRSLGDPGGGEDILGVRRRETVVVRSSRGDKEREKKRIKKYYIRDSISISLLYKKRRSCKVN